MWVAAAAENESRGLPRQVPTSPEPPAFFPDAGGLLLRALQRIPFVDDGISAEGDAQEGHEGRDAEL